MLQENIWVLKEWQTTKIGIYYPNCNIGKGKKRKSKHARGII